MSNEDMNDGVVLKNAILDLLARGGYDRDADTELALERFLETAQEIADYNFTHRQEGTTNEREA